MIGYVTLGSNDLERSGAFYDKVLSVLGASRSMQSDGFIAWNVTPTTPALSVIKPFDGHAPSVGNGTMVALVTNSHELVDQVHAAALAAGGSDEGAPGDRGNGFYAGYFRDLDGNKLNAFCFSAAADG